MVSMILLILKHKGRRRTAMVLSVEEVQQFLNEVHTILDSVLEDRCSINDYEWAGKRVNKTRRYMAESGVKISDIKEVIKELRIENYSSTKDDRNDKFPNEQVWEFGITKNLVDTEEDFYIKLKIRKFEENFLLIMSFHPEEPTKPEDKLQFPYKDYK